MSVDSDCCEGDWRLLLEAAGDLGGGATAALGIAQRLEQVLARLGEGWLGPAAQLAAAAVATPRQELVVAGGLLRAVAQAADEHAAVLLEAQRRVALARDERELEQARIRLAAAADASGGAAGPALVRWVDEANAAEARQLEIAQSGVAQSAEQVVRVLGAEFEIRRRAAAGLGWVNEAAATAATALRLANSAFDTVGMAMTAGSAGLAGRDLLRVGRWTMAERSVERAVRVHGVDDLATLRAYYRAQEVTSSLAARTGASGPGKLLAQAALPLERPTPAWVPTAAQGAAKWAVRVAAPAAVVGAVWHLAHPTPGLSQRRRMVDAGVDLITVGAGTVATVSLFGAVAPVTATVAGAVLLGAALYAGATFVVDHRQAIGRGLAACGDFISDRVRGADRRRTA